MSALAYLITFAVGFAIGAGAMLIYFQYSIYSQAGEMQEQFKKIQEMQEQEMDLGQIEEDEEE